MGRTGTFITIDAQLKRIKKEKNIDIFGFVREMRTRRCNMVQTEVKRRHFRLNIYTIYLPSQPIQAQYVFLHDALLEVIECGVTEVVARDLQQQYQMLNRVESATGKTGLQRRFMVRSLAYLHVSEGLPIVCGTETGKHTAPSTSEEFQYTARQSTQEQIHRQGYAAM